MTSQTEAVEAFASARLAELEAKGLRRALRPTLRLDDARAERAGRPLLSFCDNDYLGLSRHPRVIAAAADAARKYGAGAGAARLVSGDCPLNGRLEAKIAAMKGLPAARVFGSGYLASVGLIPALVGRGDLIVIDQLAHSCLIAGSRLSGAEIRIFPHNDAAAARAALDGPHPRKLVITETVFSMDGDVAPLAELGAACDAHGAWLVTDDAHGFGVVHLANPAPIQLGTLSKSAGAYGGYVAAPTPLVDLLASRAKSFVYTTGLPPPVLAAALAALELIDADPGLGERARANAALFCRAMGLPRPPAAIAPLVVGESGAAMAASAKLEEQGFLVTAIRPPTVPEGTARLRCTFSAAHTEADVMRLVAAVKAVLA